MDLVFFFFLNSLLAKQLFEWKEYNKAIVVSEHMPFDDRRYDIHLQSIKTQYNKNRTKLIKKKHDIHSIQ